MAAPDVLEPLAAPLAAIQRLIEQFDNRGVIIGGVAASLLGRPRLTADADVLLLLSVNDIPRLLELAGTVGLQPRLANAMEFARRNRVLLLQHVATGIGVDISLGLLPFEVETVERSVEHQVGAVRLRLPDRGLRAERFLGALRRPALEHATAAAIPHRRRLGRP